VLFSLFALVHVDTCYWSVKSRCYTTASTQAVFLLPPSVFKSPNKGCGRCGGAKHTSPNGIKHYGDTLCVWTPVSLVPSGTSPSHNDPVSTLPSTTLISYYSVCVLYEPLMASSRTSRA